MRLVTLAARNLLRNVRRTLLTVSAVAFGLMFMHLMIVLQTGQYEEMLRVGVGSMAGHVVVQADGYQEERDPDVVLVDPKPIDAALREAFPGATVAPRLFLAGVLTSSSGTVGIAMAGGDPLAEAAVQDFDDKLIEGVWLEPDDHRGMIIGAGIAKKLDVEVGDKVVYMGQHGDAEDVQSRLFRVRGIFRTGAATVDGFFALATLAGAQQAWGAPVAHQVTLHLPDATQSQAASVSAAEALAGTAGIDVLEWPDAVPELVGMIQLDRVGGDVMMVVLGLIVAMGVLNTVLMSVLERTREFGVMLAVGMKPRALATVILTEGVLLGLVGAIVGLGLGVAVSYPLVVYGLDLASLAGQEAIESGGVVISGVVHGAYNLPRMGAYTLAAIVFTTLAAIYPAQYVTRLKPVDAMRHA